MVIRPTGSYSDFFQKLSDFKQSYIPEGDPVEEATRAAVSQFWGVHALLSDVAVMSR